MWQLEVAGMTLGLMSIKLYVSMSFDSQLDVFLASKIKTDMGVGVLFILWIDFVYTCIIDVRCQICFIKIYFHKCFMIMLYCIQF